VFSAPIEVWAQTPEPPVDRNDIYVGTSNIADPDQSQQNQSFRGPSAMTLKPRISIDSDDKENSQPQKTNLLLDTAQVQRDMVLSRIIPQHLLPSNYQITTPETAFTETVAFGPRLLDQQHSWSSFYLRPMLGVSRDRILSNKSILFPKVFAAPLAPRGLITDWTGFFGLGGSAELNLSESLSLRGKIDVLYNDPSNDALSKGRWTYRYSIVTVTQRRQHKRSNRVAIARMPHHR
jgi:hypothetical protein